MVYIHLTKSQRDELSAVSRQAIGRVALRAHMVLLCDRGFTVPQIAALHACGQDVVLTWLHRYEQQGVSGLEEHPVAGAHPTIRWLDPSSMPRPVSRRLARDMSSAACASCCSRPCLSRRFRLVLSWASVRRSLHQMEWRWARPRLAPARKPDPAAEAKLAALAQAAEQARGELAHLL